MNKIIKLKEGEVIKYNHIHKKYGKAEFDICPFFKYGKLVKVRLYPRQQETDVQYYEIQCSGQTEFCLMSWTHKGIERPWAWRYYFCKEHKQLEMNVYVPKNTNQISFNNLTSFSIIFENKKNEKNKTNN